MSETRVGGDASSSAGAAREAVDRAMEGAGEMKEQAGGRLREQVETRSSEAGRQAASVAEAMRRAAGELDGEGNEQVRRLAERGAEEIERLGRYLEQSDADRMLHDVERFARSRPWVVGAGAFALGLAASRLLKASSSDRYRRAGGLTQSPDGRPEDAPIGRERSALPAATGGPMSPPGHAR